MAVSVRFSSRLARQPGSAARRAWVKVCEPISWPSRRSRATRPGWAGGRNPARAARPRVTPRAAGRGHGGRVGAGSGARAPGSQGPGSVAQRLGARECPEETVWPWLIVVVVVPDWDADDVATVVAVVVGVVVLGPRPLVVCVWPGADDGPVVAVVPACDVARVVVAVVRAARAGLVTMVLGNGTERAPRCGAAAGAG